MKSNRPAFVKRLFGFLLLLATNQLFAQQAETKPYNDTLIGVHDPVIIRQDSTYYIFCTGPESLYFLLPI